MMEWFEKAIETEVTKMKWDVKNNCFHVEEDIKVKYN